MSGVIGWVKSNILIVVFVVLTLALPPAGYVVASMWNSKIRENANEEFQSEKRRVDSASRINYVIPPIGEGETAWQESAPPNAAMIEFVAAERERRQEQIELVLERAVTFNRKDDREVLVKGLFPEAADSRAERRIAREMLEMLVGTPEQPSAYEALFDEINAGPPADAADVARAVQALKELEEQKQVDPSRSAAGQPGQRSQEEELRAVLLDQRLALYAARAAEISVYATPEILWSSTNPSTDSVVPQDVNLPVVDVETAFIWQWDYWLVQDLLAAVDLANTGADGLRADLTYAPVKRIESIRIGALELAEANDPLGSGGQGFQDDPYQPRDPRALRPSGVTNDPRRSVTSGGGAGVGTIDGPTFTGRASSQDNQVYDVRRAVVTLVIDSSRLTDVIEAFSRANFMTVTGFGLSDVDIWQDLRDGYYYGDTHVVRATLEVETVWLRYWMRDAMPPAIRAGLGVQMPEPDPSEADPTQTDKP